MRAKCEHGQARSKCPQCADESIVELKILSGGSGGDVIYPSARTDGSQTAPATATANVPTSDIALGVNGHTVIQI